MTTRNKKKMPAARATNKVADVPANINPAFSLQNIVDPTDPMLETQHWRQTGAGGRLTYDGGGREESSMSEGEVEVEENNPQEPLTYHIREYESPGRKISRDVRVVKQPSSDVGDRYEAAVVPHLLLPNGGPSLEVPVWTVNRPPEVNGSFREPEVPQQPISSRYANHDEGSSFPVGGTSLHVPNKSGLGPHFPVLPNGYDSSLVSENGQPTGANQSNRGTPNKSPDHMTLHIHEYESPQRKISFDVKVESRANGQKDDSYENEMTQHPGNTQIVAGRHGNHVSSSVLNRANAKYHRVDSDMGSLNSQGQDEVKEPSRGRGYGVIPSIRRNGIEESVHDDSIGSITERTIELDTSRTNKSLPQKAFRRNYGDYYNVDQPRHSRVDARSHQNAKRASRANVLSKAEDLLKERLAVLNGNSSDDDEPLPKSKPPRRRSPVKRGGHATDSEVTLKAKLREKTLTSPEVDSSPSPRLRKVTYTVPKRRTFLPRLQAVVPEGQDVVQNGKEAVPKRQQVVTKRPDDVTKRPDVVTKRSDVVTKRPDVVTKRPNDATKRQEVSTKRPDVATKRQTLVAKRPPNVPIRQAFMKKGTTNKKSEPTQQASEEEENVTTEGDASVRKGGPKGKRYEDAADGASSVNTGEHRRQQGGLLQGKRVAFYNFKDKGSPAAIESINKQKFPTFESLLEILTNKLQIDKGANFIYHWPSLVRIRTVDDFEAEGTYIVSSASVKKSAIEAVYGKLGPKQWHNGKVKHNDAPLIRKPPSGQDSPNSMSGQRKRPMICTLVSNSNGKQNRVILNTNEHFEDLMAGQIRDSLMMDEPACAMYAFNNGIVGREIRSLSQLVREHRNYDTFLVCGKEGLHSPNYYSNEIYRPRYRNKYIGKDSAAARGDNSDAHDSPRSSGVHNGLPPPERRVVKIQGRRRGRLRAPIDPEFYQSSVYDGEEELGKPTRKLMLDWVYGYRGCDRHKNLDMLDTAELIYYVAAVVVIYDHQKRLQRFYTDHNEDITCLTIHPNQNKVATGQTQGRGPDHGAHIRIWDVDSLATLSVIGLGFFQNGIIEISFSDNLLKQQISSDYMMAIDESFRHTMSVWDLQTERMLTKTTTNTETVTGGCFYPYADDILITYGRQHLYFWRLDWEHARSPYPKILRDKLSGYSEPENKKPVSKKKDDIPTHFTALSFTANGDVVTGDSTGTIMIWQRVGDNIFNLREDSETNMHQSAVTCLVPFVDGLMLSGGGSEIYVWEVNNGLRHPEQVQLGITGNIQALVPSNLQHEEGVIYIGTDKNCIYEGFLHNKFSPIVQGHSGESACIAVHPTEPAFVTAGKGVIMKWSAACHKCLWKTRMEGEKCTAVSIDPNDRVVAIGTKSGKVSLLDYNNSGREENTMVIGAKKINAVSFSPDGIRLAIAVDDGYLHICSVEKGIIGRLHATSNVQGLAMNNIDWSHDCKIIQTSSSDFQVFFWNVERKPKLVPGNKLRDADFVTHKSLVSGAILGPWQHLDAGETIKAVDRTNYQHKELLVTGDSMGRLRLYKYPCASPESEYRGVKAYSGAINSAVFSGDDVFVFSSASSVSNGDLKTHLGIMQWAVVDADTQILPDHHYPEHCNHNHPHHHDPHYPYHQPDYHYPPYHPARRRYPHAYHPHYYQSPYYPPHHPHFKRYQ